MHVDSSIWYQLLSAIVTIVLTWALGQASRYLRARFSAQQLATAAGVARAAVLFVEQVYRTAHGPDKLQPAIERAKALAASAGITLTDDQWETLVEQAVKQFNEWKTAITQPTAPPPQTPLQP